METKRICKHCGKEFWTHACYDSRGGGKYCSSKCYHLAQRKYKVIEHNGDKFYKVTGGYYRSASSGRLYHRVLWEESYGPIHEGCIIHHKDEDAENNTIDNLLMVSKSQHAKIHYHYALDYNRNKPFNPCVISGCSLKVKGHGLCNNHYQRFKKFEEKGYSSEESFAMLISVDMHKRVGKKRETA